MPVEGVEAPVPLRPACDALAGWDGWYEESTGAAVFREMLGSGVFERDVRASCGRALRPVEPARVSRGLPRPPADPIDDPILQALAQALVNLESAGFAPETALGDMQFPPRGTIILPRRPRPEGVIQIATYSGGASATLLETPGRGTVTNGTTDLTEDGYIVNYGNSWVMAVDMAGDSPTAQAIMTYSQAEYPASEHHADQTDLYGAEQRLRPVLFDEADILADPALVEQVLTLDGER